MIERTWGTTDIIFVLDIEYGQVDITRIAAGEDYTAVLIVNSEGPLIQAYISEDLPLDDKVLVCLLPEYTLEECADYIMGLLPEYDSENPITLAAAFEAAGIVTFENAKLNNPPRG